MSETVAARDAARRLTWQILIALLLGGSFGVLLNWLAPHFPWMQTYIVDGALKLIGGLFRNGLQLLVVPLVFFSLVAGTASLRDPASLGRLGYKTLGLYLLTTLLAVSMALVLASLIQPGSGVERAAEAASYTPPLPSAPWILGLYDATEVAEDQDGAPGYSDDEISRLSKEIEQLRAEAARMLADPRASAAMQEFFAQYFDLGRLDGVTRDVDAYPMYASTLPRSMRTELQLLRLAYEYLLGG